jgi:hypothetical protein
VAPRELERTPANNMPVARIETHDPPIPIAARPITIKGAVAIKGLNATVAAMIDNTSAVAAGNIAAAAGPMTAVGSAVRIILPIEMIPIIWIVVVAGNSRTKVEYIRCGGMVASDDQQDSQSGYPQCPFEFHDEYSPLPAAAVALKAKL